MKRTFEVAPWNIVTHDFDSEDKRLQESMTSLGNGYMGMRGFFEEDYSGDTLNGIYLGGVWYPDKTRVGWWKNGYPDYFGKVVNAVNFIKMHVKINGEVIDLAKDQFSDFELNLDMKKALLTRSFTVTKGDAKVAVKFERFLSVAQQELSVQRVTVQNVGSNKVDLVMDSAIDGDVKNEDANYDERFWEVLSTEQGTDSGNVLAETTPNPFGTPRFTSGMEMRNVTDLTAEKVAQPSEKEVVNEFSGALAPNESAQLEKRVIVVTSRDYDTQAALTDAMHQLSDQVAGQSYDDLLTAHEQVWADRWNKSDIVIDGDTEAQQGIRFNLFQLFSTYYGEDSRLNIGPKGFTGEKYGGATYWDTEAFAVPVYLGITDPKVTRNLLMYRYKQLDGAYHNAKQQGLKGALFPMVTFDGIECHNEWEITFEEIHRNGDIAFAIYNYTRYTGDTSYVLNEGSKVLTEISRFWADRVHYSQRNQNYMIHGVTGPDEYENNVDNNWYTNLLAQWTLKYTLEILKEVSPEQAKQLNVSEDEKKHWQDIVDNMYLPYDKDLNIFVQHDGFLDKDLKPVSEIPADQLPLNQNWSWDKILRSPYIKQGDVLQGIWDFIDDFTPEQKKSNFDFYEQYTVHESSLSPAIYSVLAADLHYEDKAVELYERTARLDLDNYNNDTVDGLHITAMTGGWIAVVQGFAGMRVRDGKLHYAPFLPKKWSHYSFRQVFRDRLIEVDVDQDGSHFKLIDGEPITIDVAGKAVELTK
ncbi:glycoside hydrolase family 65 protein [Lentilactobacillus buchneri]|uniref:Maltose phosphorylase n=2 Tax=Lentilactobacillus buchneri TaxID=1581 RepID=J9W4N7_LENBU|nr:glycoside hydrolase family 65 protein [Lentilactobacillus buchneri]AFS01304.1 maltose phosphorylase [Lentilactobacillus buchneri subsp. silagei CD034]MCT2901029.1 glycoside hydrolase family 65 protein [Lentilactobacillus buchneri]MCT3542737.1 glycoside hydrolase family 65 protein [Lentilactobacillus buchneri]MCT3545878.1 glycoside hydrolase family 65 protein [Lentilactobacillus buchneri]MCT3552846.1 glycoside hydrolase family 65 protein [Lentilactobacillus buchneri]